MPRPHELLVSCACAALVFAVALPVSAATWEADAVLTNERKNEITDSGSDVTESFEQSYTLSYDHDIHSDLSYSFELTLDVVDEINEGPDPDTDFDTREVTPKFENELVGPWWDLYGGWESSKKTSDDPSDPKKVEEAWATELTVEPASEALPSLNLRYERDRTEEGSDPLTREDLLEGSLDYTFWDLVDVTFDVKQDTQRDLGGLTITSAGTGQTLAEIDKVKRDREYQFDIGFDKEFGERFTVEAEWSNERQRTEEWFDSSFPPVTDYPDGIRKGELTSRDDTLKNNLRGTVTYTPLDDLELSLDREVDWQKDFEASTLETTDTWTGGAAYNASVTETIDVDLEYSDERKDTRGTTNDSYAITRDYAAAVDFAPFETITLTPSFDRSDKVEWFDDPATSTEDSTDDTWEVNLDTSFWDDQFGFAVTRTYKLGYENGERSTNERNWDVDTAFTWEHLPNLVLEPQYTYTEDDDLLKHVTDVEHKVDFNIGYELTLGEVLTFAVDHTYSRTAKSPGEGIATTQRDDDTSLTLTWSEFFEGMELELGLDRQASDESKDDKLAEVDYTYTVTYDWIFLENYNVTFEYEQDKKSASEDTRNYYLTLGSELLEGLLAVDFEWELDQQLEGDKKDTYRYLIEIEAQF